MKHFLSIAALAPAELHSLLSLAMELKQEWRSGGNKPYLQGKSLALVFQKPSLRTRVAFEMGMVNAVIPHAELESTAYEWAQEILAKSPTSIKMLKFAMNLTDDGMVGQQVFAGEATRLAYMTDEAKEGRDAFLEKRKPNFPKKWIP